MTDNINPTEENNHNEPIHSIPQHQIISYLRHYFETNNPNNIAIAAGPDHYYNNLRPTNHPLHLSIDEEDKDETEDNYLPLQEEHIQYHQVERQYTGEEDDIEDYHSDDSDAFSQDAYVDFRVYPLGIDWFEIENCDTNYFAILEHYGYFGAATLTGIANVNDIELLVDDFIYSLIGHYYDLVAKKDEELTENFMTHLPAFMGIKCILKRKMFNQKEIVIIKVVIDIYDHYLRTIRSKMNCFIKKKSFMTLICLFYSILTEEDITFLYNELTHKMQKTRTLLTKLGCKVFKQKSQYLKYYNEKRLNVVQLLGGINKDKFLL